ncbi:MAG: DUF4012 domain-containing protein [Microthrixaceae bacterium]
MGLAGDRSSSSRRLRRDPSLLVASLALGTLGAFGGARPTGIGWLDAMLLGLGGAAAAACGTRARTIPLYVAAAAAALFQPATLPLALACVALAAAFARSFWQGWSLAGALAGGLAWAAAVGAPFEPGARPLIAPMVALAWMVVSARRHGGRRFCQRVDRVALAVGGVAVGASLLGALSVINARVHLDRGADLLESGLAAARSGDTEGAVADLRAARRALGRGQDSLGALWARPGWIVPGVSQNTRAVHHTVAEVAELASVGIRAAEDADLESLRARAGQVDLAAVSAMEEPLADVLAQLRTSGRTVESLADAFLLPPVRSRLDVLRGELADAIPSAELALDGVRVAPELVGGDGTRTYLVLFTTPVEARARTGFPGNYAEVTFTDGRFDMTRFGRIAELDRGPTDPPRTLTGPPDYLARYARFGVAGDWRNIAMSPDFPTIATVAAELYPQTGRPPVDGVMSVDPVALAALLRFTGPIAVPGVATPLDADNAAQFLLRDQYVELPETPERVDALEALAELTFGHLTTADLPGPRELGRTLGPVVEEGHLQVMAFGHSQVSFLDRLGISGRYPAVDGDFVGVTTSNAAASKIDLFLRRTLDYDVTWDPSTGRLSATATITLTNEAPGSGLPDALIGNSLGLRPLEKSLPPGWNNTFLTLYTPWDQIGATLDGKPLALERIDELGRHAISTFVPIGPGTTRTIVIKLQGLLAGPTYRLGLAPQPQVEPEVATVRVAVVGGGRLRLTGPVEVRGPGVEGTFPLVRNSRIVVGRR